MKYICWVCGVGFSGGKFHEECQTYSCPKGHCFCSLSKEAQLAVDRAMQSYGHWSPPRRRKRRRREEGSEMKKWLEEEERRELLKELPGWAIEWAEEVAVPGEVGMVREIGRFLIEIGGRASPGPLWLTVKQRGELIRKYGTIAARWAEELSPPGTPIEEVEKAAQAFLKKMYETLRII